VHDLFDVMKTCRGESDGDEATSLLRSETAASPDAVKGDEETAGSEGGSPASGTSCSEERKYSAMPPRPAQPEEEGPLIAAALAGDTDEAGRILADVERQLLWALVAASERGNAQLIKMLMDFGKGVPWACQLATLYASGYNQDVRDALRDRGEETYTYEQVLYLWTGAGKRGPRPAPFCAAQEG